MKLKYIVPASKLNNFIPLPIGLLKTDLSSTTILVYGILISRATLSQKNGWVDEKGHVYIRYSNKELASDAGKSISTIKNCLKELSDKGFIIRKRIDVDAKLIYVLVPEESLADKKLATKETDYKPSRGQNIGWNRDKKVATNYIRETNYRTKEYNSQEGESF